MKKLFTLLLAGAMFLLMATGLHAQDNPQATAAEPAPKLTFVKAEHDFGDIKQGESVEYTFRFENTGNVPLVLEKVRTTCGCTAINWPKEPIAPGEKGEIKTRFDSTGKSGPQTKIITVFSNASNPQERIVLKTNIIVPK